MIDYKEIMESLNDLTNQYVLITGTFDLFEERATKIEYWIKAGSGNEELMEEAIKCYEFEKERNGFYGFMALMTYDGGQYDNYGRCECRAYMEIREIDLNFICTFESRNREDKLNILLHEDFNLF